MTYPDEYLGASLGVVVPFFIFILARAGSVLDAKPLVYKGNILPCELSAIAWIHAIPLVVQKWG